MFHRRFKAQKKIHNRGRILHCAESQNKRGNRSSLGEYSHPEDGLRTARHGSLLQRLTEEF